MIASVIVSAVLLSALIVGYALRQKHPESLSAIYYGMANGWMFPLTLGVCAALIIAPMFEITPERLQFLVFLVWQVPCLSPQVLSIVMVLMARYIIPLP